EAADVDLEVRGAPRGFGGGPRGLLALQHLIGELLSRRQLLGTLAHPDVPQEPAQVRRLAVAAREGRHGESGDERSAVARSYAHGPFTVAPDVRVVHAPAEHPEIGLVDEQRERLADEKAARDSEQV